MPITLIAIAAALAYHKRPRVLLVLHGARQLNIEHLLPAVKKARYELVEASPSGGKRSSSTDRAIHIEYYILCYTSLV